MHCKRGVNARPSLCYPEHCPGGWPASVHSAAPARRRIPVVGIATVGGRSPGIAREVGADGRRPDRRPRRRPAGTPGAEVVALIRRGLGSRGARASRRRRATSLHSFAPSGIGFISIAGARGTLVGAVPFRGLPLRHNAAGGPSRAGGHRPALGTMKPPGRMGRGCSWLGGRAGWTPGGGGNHQGGDMQQGNANYAM